jgi:hypothetical protein
LEEVVALADDPSLRANQEENSDGEISN